MPLSISTTNLLGGHTWVFHVSLGCPLGCALSPGSSASILTGITGKTRHTQSPANAEKGYSVMLCHRLSRIIPWRCLIFMIRFYLRRILKFSICFGKIRKAYGKHMFAFQQIKLKAHAAHNLLNYFCLRARSARSVRVTVRRIMTYLVNLVCWCMLCML